MPAPLLSIVVVAYRMAPQLVNTALSLSAQYQRDVDAGQYEVILVENDSDRSLDAVQQAALPPNFRYFLRQESRPTPAHALNFGLQQTRGKRVGVMIDGAHLLTPGILACVIELLSRDAKAIVAVPVYHLGEEEQNISAAKGYDEVTERALLSSVDWPSDGYELFRIGCWCHAHRNGFLQPIMESNLYFAPRAALESTGFDPAEFELPGGGAMNLHLFRSLGMQGGSRYYVLPGEGTFHQYHGGITSGVSRDDYRFGFRDHLNTLWPGGFQALRREPRLYGHIPEQATDFFCEAARLAQRRARRARKLGEALWPDDDLPG